MSIYCSTFAVMDYINLLVLMLSCNNTYNLILEDDVKPAKHALHKAHEFAVSLENQTDWGFLTFYNVIRGKSFVSDARKTWLTGACAWLYRKEVAEGCLQMLREDPQRWPVDLLVPQYVFDKLNLKAYERTPNLFQHISSTSTYTGKVRYSYTKCCQHTHCLAIYCMVRTRVLELCLIAVITLAVVSLSVSIVSLQIVTLQFLAIFNIPSCSQ